MKKALFALTIFACKGPISGIAVGHQQDVVVEHGREIAVQLLLGHGAIAGHEINGFISAIACHQNANLFTGNATPGGFPPRRRAGRSS
jgi:hypothetical protein